MSAASHGGDGGERRDFLVITAGAFVGVGAVGLVWPFVDQMNPSADVLALSSTEVDISGIEPGQSVTISWRGKPVFVRRRTEAEIDAALAVDMDDLPDPQNPFGARGIGEPAMGCSVAALQSAIADAMDGQIFGRSPVSPDMVVNHVAERDQSFLPLQINNF